MLTSPAIEIVNDVTTVFLLNNIKVQRSLVKSQLSFEICFFIQIISGIMRQVKFTYDRGIHGGCLSQIFRRIEVVCSFQLLAYKLTEKRSL
jgi:hypothetical protein